MKYLSVVLVAMLSFSGAVQACDLSEEDISIMKSVQAPEAVPATISPAPEVSCDAMGSLGDEDIAIIKSVQS